MSRGVQSHLSPHTSSSEDGVTVLQFVLEPDLEFYEVCTTDTNNAALPSLRKWFSAARECTLFTREVSFFSAPSISDKRVVYYEGVQASS
jgi:hypothetical protein